MSNRSIKFAGHSFELHPSGAMFWNEKKTLVVGDLHFEKASSYHSTRQFLPPYDSVETLCLLTNVIKEFFPKRLIFLGDVFHDKRAWLRMLSSQREELKSLLSPFEIIWIEGNHDDGFVIPGYRSHADYRIDGLTFRHVTDLNSNNPEISGHFHPIAIVKHRGLSIRRACFVCAENRLLLPAFGALTGGLNVASAELTKFHGSKTQLYLLGKKSVYSIPFGFSED